MPKFCGKCGATIKDGEKFCPKCGAKTPASEARQVKAEPKREVKPMPAPPVKVKMPESVRSAPAPAAPVRPRVAPATAAPNAPRVVKNTAQVKKEPRKEPIEALVRIENVFICLSQIFLLTVLAVDFFYNRELITSIFDLKSAQGIIMLCLPAAVVLALFLFSFGGALKWSVTKNYNRIYEPLCVISALGIIAAVIFYFIPNFASAFGKSVSLDFTIFHKLLFEANVSMIIVYAVIFAIGIIRIFKKLYFRKYQQSA